MQSSGVPFSNALSNLRQIGTARVTWAFVIAMLALHASVEWLGGVDAVGAFYESLGLSRDGVLSGKIWQIVSHGFLHGSWMHVGVNALFLLLIGSRIEHMTGSKSLAGAVFASIAGGGIAHLLIGGGLLVGMSGGCVGLLLLLVTLSPQSRMFPLPLSGRSLGLGILIAALMLALMNPSLGVPWFSDIGRYLERQGSGGWFLIGHACHFGGGLTGVIFGLWILRPTVTLDRLQRERARREAALDRNVK